MCEKTVNKQKLVTNRIVNLIMYSFFELKASNGRFAVLIYVAMDFSVTIWKFAVIN